MSSFRKQPDMFVPAAKPFLIPWAPPSNWSRYDAPARERLPSRAECATQFREAAALRYLRQAS